MLLHQARQGCVELLLHVLFLELHLLLLVDFDQLIPLSFKLCHILDLAINELLYMFLPAQDMDGLRIGTATDMRIEIMMSR